MTSHRKPAGIRRVPGAALTLTAVAILTAATGLQAQKPDILTIDQLLSIESVVSGSPAWSPDGSGILFQSSLSGGLMTISPDGGFPTRLPIEMGSSGHFLASQLPGWSPSGNWISYVSDKDGSPEIWIWSTRDGTERRLTGLGGRINSMTWSPDERSIAFAGDRYGNYDIWTVEVATGRVQRITSDKLYEVFPTWTPDSERILYVRLNDTWEDHDVIEVAPDGSGARTVLQDTDFFDYGAGTTFAYPRVSPDGSQVLFRSHRSGWINYWLAPIEGGEPRPMAAAEADQSSAALVAGRQHDRVHREPQRPSRPARRCRGRREATRAGVAGRNGRQFRRRRRVQSLLVARRTVDLVHDGRPSDPSGSVCGVFGGRP